MDEATPRLDDMIDLVKAQQPEDDPLARLSAAVLVSDRLGELADHLVGHFVDQARRAGASWTDIGASMGVSKQAVQKRFVPKVSEEPVDAGVFSRFTDRARHCVVAAQEEARNAGHDHIGSEHVVLGLLAEPEGTAARVIVDLGVDPEAVRESIAGAFGPAVANVPGHIPFDAHGKKAIHLAVREALRLGHDHIGTEHLLLGVLAGEGGEGKRALEDLGVHRDRVSDELEGDF